MVSKGSDLRLGDGCMEYPFIVAVGPHNTRENEYVVLGTEDDSLDGFFTRRASGINGAQFSGNYRLTLGEAYADFESRKAS